MKCHKCNKVFTHQLSFKVHSDYCYSDKKCKVCHKKFTNLKTLRRHVISVHEKALIYKCDKCDKKFSVQNHLHLHKLKEHENVQFKCANCCKKFAHSTNLRKHLEKCKPESPSQLLYQCDLCHRSFRFESSLKQHVGKCPAKNNSNKSGEICTICQLTFHNSDDMRQHIKKVHSKTASPAKLTVLRSNKSNMMPEDKEITLNLTKTLQFANETKENIAQVKQIPNKRRVSNLMTTPNKAVTIAATSGGMTFYHQPFSVRCQKCAKSFTKARHELYWHEEMMHNIVRPYECPICDFKFFTRKDYSEHLRKIHDHKCDVCGTSFSEKSDFIAHYDTGMCESSNMLQFINCLVSACDVCHKKFRGAQDLEMHVNRVHGEKSFHTKIDATQMGSKQAFLAYFGLQQSLRHPSHPTKVPS